MWHDPAAMRVLGMGEALPGEPIETAALLERIARKLGIDVRERGARMADRLGVRQRHSCRPFDDFIEAPRPGQRNGDLAARAVGRALDEAGLRPGALGYLIGHTATPGTALPANIAQVAKLLGYEGPFAEFRQACTGFANALVMALGLLRGGSAPVAIVGSETGSVHFAPRRAADDTGQLVSMMQMGDGAAAIILTMDDARPGARLSHVFHGQIGPGRPPGLAMPDGGSDSPAVPGGLTDFRHEFAAVRETGPELLRRCAEAAAECGIVADWTLPHQANGTMDRLLEEHLGLPRERVVNTAAWLGNTGSAAIWLALSQHRSRLAPGEAVMALGAEATAYMFGGFRYQHA